MATNSRMMVVPFWAAITLVMEQVLMQLSLSPTSLFVRKALVAHECGLSNWETIWSIVKEVFSCGDIPVCSEHFLAV